MIICLDIDGVLCEESSMPYDKRMPYKDIIAKVNALYVSGHHIIIFTGRGTKTGIDWSRRTKKQLKRWNIKYHELIFGKPAYDIFIDDKAHHNINSLNNILNDD